MSFTKVQVVLLVAVLVLGLSIAGWWAGVGRLAVSGDAGQAMPVIAAEPAAQLTTQQDPASTGAGTGPAGQAGQADAAGGASGQATASASGRPALIPAGLVSASWVAQETVATGIPAGALQAYAGAAIVTARQHPGCHLGWNTLAGIGMEESAHGTTGGAYIQADGQVHGVILGPVLDGGSYGKVPDTDHGALDGNTRWDRAVGPMQILPATWARYGVDANGDGKADPNQIDDAALTAADYLCTAGGDLGTAAGWVKAIHAYNPNDAYIAAVRDYANRYAQEAG